MKKTRWAKPFVFAGCLLPLGSLIYKGFAGELGANPVEVITHSTGTWTLIFLLITLSITPLRKVLKQPWLIQFRRMIGLFAFFYVCLHLLTYLWLDQSFSFQSIIKDVYKRPFITAGFTAFVLMVPLALTSTGGWIRRLGGRRWSTLHRLVYVSATAGVIHFYWLVKRDVTRPVQFATVLGILLSFRLVVWLWNTYSTRMEKARSTSSAA